MSDVIVFTGRKNRITDVDGRGGVEIRDRVERLRRTLHRETGTPDEVQVDFLEDELRETASTIGSLEESLRRLLTSLEKEPLSAEDLIATAEDDELIGRLDYLRDITENLQRRLAQIAVRLPAGRRVAGGA